MLTKEYLHYLIVLLLFLTGTLFYYVYTQQEQAPLTVHFLDIGQGDAILISDDRGNQILIDGEPNGRKLLYQLGKEMPLLDKKIEAVILTHPDADHLTGLLDLLESYQVEIFLNNGQRESNPLFKELEKLLSEKKIFTKKVNAGDLLKFGEIELLVLSSGGENDKNKNQASIVAKLIYGENSFLFTGDIEAEKESQLVLSNADLKADWLKVGHHGSANGTSNFFLRKVQPRHAAISVGEKNRFGHPASVVLENLKKHKVNIWRTDKQGTISVECDLNRCVPKTKNNLKTIDTRFGN